MAPGFPELGPVAPHRREVGEVDIQIGDLVHVVAGDGDGRPEGFGEVDGDVLLVTGVTEGLHRPHDRRDPVDALECLGHCPGDLGQQVVQIEPVLRNTGVAPALGPPDRVRGVDQAPVEPQQLGQVVEGGGEEAGVVPDELDR